jgi:hypothetical protein
VIEPQQVLLDDRDVLIVRLNGVLRTPDDGRHRRLIVFTGPTLEVPEIPRRLRQLADKLDDLLWLEGQA